MFRQDLSSAALAFVLAACGGEGSDASVLDPPLVTNSGPESTNPGRGPTSTPEPALPPAPAPVALPPAPAPLAVPPRPAASPPSPRTEPKPVIEAASWSVPNVTFTPGGSFNLRATLPADIPRGGTFAVAAGALPAGVSLSKEGLLTVSRDAPASSLSGVTFSYTY